VAQTPACTRVTAPATSSDPANVPGTQAHSSDLGFTYSLPTDWEVMDTKPMVPALHQQMDKLATSDI